MPYKNVFACFRKDLLRSPILQDHHGVVKRKENHMASKTKEARLGQKEYWDGLLKERLSLLAEKGLDADSISIDVTVRKLRAKIRETAHRLRAIDGKEQKTEEMARIKAEKLAAPKVKKSGKKKAAEEEAVESKRQQKKKKKKEGQAKEPE